MTGRRLRPHISAVVGALCAIVLVVSMGGCAQTSVLSPEPTAVVTPEPEVTVLPKPAPVKTPEPTADTDLYAVPSGFSIVLNDKLGPMELLDVRDGWVTYTQMDHRAQETNLVTVTSHAKNKFSSTLSSSTVHKTPYGDTEFIQWAYSSPSFGTVFGISDSNSTWYEIRLWDVESGAAPERIWKSTDPDRENDLAAFHDGILYFPRQDKGNSCLSTMKFDGKAAPTSTLKNIVCSDQNLWWIKSAPDGTVSYLVGNQSHGSDCAHLYRVLPGADSSQIVDVPGGCVGRGQADATYAMWTPLPDNPTKAGPMDWGHRPMSVMTTADGKVTDLGDGSAGTETFCEGGVAWQIQERVAPEVTTIMSWQPNPGPQIIYESTRRVNENDRLEAHYAVYGPRCFDNKIAFFRSGDVLESDTHIVEELYRTTK